MKSPKTDPQQYRAYAWEGSLYDWSTERLSDKALTTAVAKACRMYRVPVPAVHFARADTYKGRKLTSSYDPNDHSITLRPRHRNLNTALHEAAHAVTDYVLGPWSTEAHGKEWLGVFMVILERFKLSPRAALAASAEAKGLKFEPYGRVSPKAIRKTFRKLYRANSSERRTLRDLGII